MNAPNNQQPNTYAEGYPIVPPLPDKPAAPKPTKFRIPTWVFSVMLFIMLIILIFANYRRSVESGSLAFSHYTDNYRKATELTKLAFGHMGSGYVPPLTMIGVGMPSSTLFTGENISDPVPSGQKNRLFPEDSDADRLHKAALERWLKLTKQDGDTREALRKLGIVRILFNEKQSGLQALRTIRTLPEADSIVDTVNPGSFALSPKQEVVFWNTVYASKRINKEQVPILKRQLQTLKQGWFEHIVLATIYDKAGDSRAAAEANRRAFEATKRLEQAVMVEALVMILGLLAIVAYSIIWLVQRIADENSRPKTMNAPQGQSDDYYYLPVEQMKISETVSRRVPRVAFDRISQLSYRARAFAFVTYLASFTLMNRAYPMIFYRTEPLHSDEQIRFNILYGIMASLLSVVLALVMLAWVSFRERGTWLNPAKMLANIGLRTDNIFADILTAVLGYIMLIPTLVAMALISHFLFSKIPTPTNPAVMMGFVATAITTKMLLLFQTAVIAPFTEELMFRGLLFQALHKRWGTLLGASGSAAVFAFCHNTLPGGFLTLFSIGFLLAVSYRSRNSIFPSIMIHAIYNGVIMWMMFTVFGT